MKTHDERGEFIARWNAVRPEVLRIARRYALGVDAADLEQDLVALAWSRRSDFADAEHLRRWALQRARWLALDRLRASPRAREVFARFAEHEVGAMPEASTGPVQEHLVAVREVADAISRLPPRQRRVLQGLFLGRTDAEIAEELKIDSETVRSLRRFGRARLHALLETEVDKA